MVHTEADEWCSDMAAVTIYNEKSSRSSSAGLGTGLWFENRPDPVLTDGITCPAFSIRGPTPIIVRL